MANFLEALTGATTLLGGLAQILNQGAERTRKQDLLDAQLLAQLKDYEFVPADTAQPASFWQRLGGAQYEPQGTMPVITIGGKPMTLRPRQTLFDFLQSSFGPQKTAEASQPVGQQSAETATIPQAPSPSLVRTTPSSQTATLPTQATIPALPGEGAQGLQQRKQRLTATLARVVDQGQRTRILDEISKIDDEIHSLNAETASATLPQVAGLPSGAPAGGYLGPQRTSAGQVATVKPQSVHGYEVRQTLTPEEQEFFRSNPQNAGMAADDGRIILNPYSKRTSQEMQSVAQNEAVRLYMQEKDYAPTFALTLEQQAMPHFATGEYSKPENATERNASIVARLVAGDPSAGTPTPEQQQWADRIRTEIGQRTQDAQAESQQRGQPASITTASSVGKTSTTAPAPKTATPSPLAPIQQRYAKALEQYGYQDAELLVRDPAILTILSKRGASVQDFLTALNTAQTRINLQEQRRLQREDKASSATKALEDERAKASKVVQDWYKEGALNDQQYQAALQMVEQAPDIPGVAKVYTRFKIAPVTAEERKRREQREDERLTLQKQTHDETVALRKSNAAAREEDKRYRRDEREQKTIQEAREHITRLSLQKANLLKEKVPDALAGTIAYVTGTGNAKAMENLKNIMGGLQSGGDADEARKSAMEVLNQLQRHYIDQLPVTERQILHEIVGTPLVPATVPVKRVK